MKDIKDYLHLYLGCRVIPNERVTEAEMVILRGVYTFDANYKVNLCRCQMSTLPGENVLWLEHDEFKLILRPLSDMTELERKELWRLVFSQGHGKNFSEAAKNFTGRVVFIDEKTYYQVPRHVMMQGVERLAIESDGTIWADCDLHNWRHNQHETTRWLLSKGFDLFGLIEAGLAIDKTTLKP